MVPFEEAVITAKVFKICDQVGYHAISKESSSVLVDLYARTIIHLARHCKEFANNNRRVEPTLIDLVQAYDFIGISIPELKEHAENVRIPLELKIELDDPRPSNRIQRNLFVDDLLEAEKNNGDENDEGGENKTSSENGDEQDKNMTPLLRDIYQDISKKYSGPEKPVMADKVRIKREEKPVIPKLKITPLDPSIAEPPSFLPILENSKQDNLMTNIPTQLLPAPEPIASTSGGSKIRKKKGLLQKGSKGARSKDSTPKKLNRKDKKKLARRQTDSQKNKTLTIKTAKKDKKKVEQQSLEGTVEPQIPPAKLVKKEKKRKRSNDEFAIVNETAIEDKEWLCPTCNGPDNGDLMIGCDTCELWYHLRCTNLKRAPKDEEKWSCTRCVPKKEKLKPPTPSPSPPPRPTLDPTPTTPSPPPQLELPPPAPVSVIAPPVGTSQDDLCPECNLPDDGTLMIQCDDPCCARWFHGKCVSVLEEPKDDESWFCKGCVEKQQSAFKRRRRPK